MNENNWIECTCDYQGYADMVTYPEIPDVSFPTCPECGQTVYDVVYPDVKELKK